MAALWMAAASASFFASLKRAATVLAFEGATAPAPDPLPEGWTDRLSYVETSYSGGRVGVHVATPPEGTSPVDAIVLLCHDSLDRLVREGPACGGPGESSMWSLLADVVASETGATSVAFEYPGYGTSMGGIGMAAAEAAGVAALLHARRVLGRREGSLVLVGQGLGAAVAGRLSSHRQVSGSLASAVLVGPFGSEFTRSGLPRVPRWVAVADTPACCAGLACPAKLVDSASVSDNPAAAEELEELRAACSGEVVLVCGGESRQAALAVAAVPEISAAVVAATSKARC